MIFRHWITILSILCGLTTFAQIDTTDVGTPLKEVFISAFHINDTLMEAPASIAILSETDLQRNNNADISTSVNTVAGVFMQSGSYNTNRISIRGIGARTPYGTNKIRAFYGSIPLTSGDSETTIEDIDIENLDQVEIIKGPLSSVYGAGLGGAILLTPKMLQNDGHEAQISTTYGSFGLAKSRFTYGINGKSASLNINYHQLESDGWRQNSAYDREGITIAGELFRSSTGKLTYFGNYTNLKAYIPSSIDRETFINNPQSAAFTWNAAKGFEEYESYLGGIAYDWKLSNKISNATSLFVNFKDSNEPRPFDILRQQTSGLGGRTQFTGEFDSIKFIVGAEYFRDGFEGQTLENLYEDNNGNGSVAGQQLTGTEQDRNFYNAFAQIRIRLAKMFEAQAGVNVNQTNFSLKNVFPANAASSQQYKYETIWSPQLSLLFLPSVHQTLYASVSRGFSMPAIEETLTAQGTINPDIVPENGYNLEVGGKFYFFNRALFAEIAAYRMQIRDLLVAQRVGDDQYVGINAGKTLHQGIEIAVNYHKRFSKWLIISPFTALTIGNYKFVEFDSNGMDYSGNELTGVPANKINAGVTIESDLGLYLSGDFQFVDGFPMNDANTFYNDAYRIYNIKTGYKFSVLENLHSSISMGVNNAGNEHYAAMILVNATGFGGASPRYYYPGAPVNYYASLSFKYLFD